MLLRSSDYQRLKIGSLEFSLYSECFSRRVLQYLHLMGKDCTILFVSMIGINWMYHIMKCMIWCIQVAVSLCSRFNYLVHMGRN